MSSNQCAASVRLVRFLCTVLLYFQCPFLALPMLYNAPLTITLTVLSVCMMHAVQAPGAVGA